MQIEFTLPSVAKSLKNFLSMSEKSFLPQMAVKTVSHLSITLRRRSTSVAIRTCSARGGSGIASRAKDPWTQCEGSLDEALLAIQPATNRSALGGPGLISRKFTVPNPASVIFAGPARGTRA